MSDFLDDLLDDKFDELLDIENSDKYTESKKDSTSSESYEQLLQSIIERFVKSGAERERLNSQLVVIRKILNAYLSGKKAFILQAPTGAGKSIISIFVSEVIRLINNDNSIQSYYLTSNKQLQDQLQRDIDRFSLRWSVLKGRANYPCTKNGKTFLERACEPYSINKVKEKWDCAAKCPYIVARDKAIEYDSAVMSYAYFLTVLNYSYEFLQDNSPFAPRHFTIFDECHQIADIVQNMFSVTLTKRYEKQFEKLVQYVILNGVTDEELSLIREQIEVTRFALDKFFIVTESSIEPNTLLEELLILSNRIGDFVIVMNDHMNEKHSKNLIEHQQRLEDIVDTFLSLKRTISYFHENNKDHPEMIHVATEIDKYYGKKIILRTLNERYMLQRHVHRYTEFSLFMSATIGGSAKDIHTFANDKGIEDYDFALLDSDFNYNDSEIYKVKPMINLGSKYIRETLPTAVEKVIEIANFHKNFKGIIHTVSFYITDAIKKASFGDDRFLFYNDSEEKQRVIEKHYKSTNTILVGPSLLEGLDLPDEHARFAIIVKVPFPSLDEFNKKKMQYFPNWYDWITGVSFMQALGRPIRHKDDWCVTYVIDSNINFFLSKNEFPNYVTRRLRSIDSQMFESPELKEKRQKEIDNLFDFM